MVPKKKAAAKKKAGIRLTRRERNQLQRALNRLRAGRRRIDDGIDIIEELLEDNND